MTLGHWLRVSEAARLLGRSDDTVRRMLASGQLDGTRDPDLVAGATPSAGRPPQQLVSLSSVLANAPSGTTRGPELRENGAAESSALQAEIGRLRAELAKAREVARLALVKEALRDQMEEVTRQQLAQFLVQDFPND
jgi:hypothetical protein